MGAALRIILIIVVAWYIIRVIDRIIAPALFGNKEKKKPPAGSKGKEFRKSTRQGDVTITDYGKKDKDVKPPDDDFVDYEEVD
jgi:hypothetical protein